jgi:hypothetical protein
MNPLLRRMLIGLLIGPMVGGLAFVVLLHGPLCEIYSRRYPNQPPIIRERVEQRLAVYLMIAGTALTSIVAGVAGHLQLFRDRKHPSLGRRIIYVALFAVAGAVAAQPFRPLKGPPNIIFPIAGALLGWTWLVIRQRRTMRAIDGIERDTHAER